MRHCALVGGCGTAGRCLQACSSSLLEGMGEQLLPSPGLWSASSGRCLPLSRQSAPSPDSTRPSFTARIALCMRGGGRTTANEERSVGPLRRTWEHKHQCPVEEMRGWRAWRAWRGELVRQREDVMPLEDAGWTLQLQLMCAARVPERGGCCCCLFLKRQQEWGWACTRPARITHPRLVLERVFLW